MQQPFEDYGTDVNLLAPATVVVDSVDRPRISPATRNRLVDKGLQFPVPSGRLSVVMMDEIVHTLDFPICADETCICHELEYLQACADSNATKKRTRRKNKALVRATYDVPGSLAPVNQGFNMMR